MQVKIEAPTPLTFGALLLVYDPTMGQTGHSHPDKGGRNACATGCLGTSLMGLRIFSFLGKHSMMGVFTLGSAMSGRKLLSFAFVGSAAAYFAHFVVEQIDYLREKLSPPAVELKLAPDWPGVVPSLPQLEDLPEGNFQNEIHHQSQS